MDSNPISSSNVPDPVVVSGKGGNNTLKIIIAVIVLVLIICCVSSFAGYWLMRQKAKKMVEGNLETIEQIKEIAENESKKLDDDNDVKEANNDEYIQLGKTAGNETWELKVVKSKMEDKTIVIEVQIKNVGKETSLFFPYLWFKLENKNNANLNYGLGYITNFTVDVEQGKFNDYVNSGETFNAELAYDISDGADLEEIYLKFFPDSKSEYKLDVV